jgi:hypothetical protein
MCSGPVTSSGYNFANETANSCNLVATGDSSVDANDPSLGPLADTGGPTLTRLPLARSPLIDAIPNAACQTAPLASGVTTDQRDLARPGQPGGACDIGAVEVQPSPKPNDRDDDHDRDPAVVPQPVVSTPLFTG